MRSTKSPYLQLFSEQSSKLYLFVREINLSLNNYITYVPVNDNVTLFITKCNNI